MFTCELQRRLAPSGATVAAAAHPGGADTALIAGLARNDLELRRWLWTVSEELAGTVYPV